MTQNTRNNGIVYEKLTQRVFQAIIDQDVVPNIEVQNNIPIEGMRTRYQIDIFWEFQVGGYQVQERRRG